MIREATKEDIPEIIDMVKSMLVDLNEPWSEACVVNTIAKSLALAPCFLYTKNDKIIAMAGLSLRFQPFTGQAALTDYGFYTRPRHRSWSVYGGLIDKCKEYAEKVNLPLQLNFAADKPVDFAQRLAKRKDLKIVYVTGEYNGR